jgi:hypothetical protein
VKDISMPKQQNWSEGTAENIPTTSAAAQSENCLDGGRLEGCSEDENAAIITGPDSCRLLD